MKVRMQNGGVPEQRAEDNNSMCDVRTDRRRRETPSLVHLTNMTKQRKMRWVGHMACIRQK